MEIKKDFIQRLRGRAEFCRDRGEVKTPELLEHAAQLLEEKAQTVLEGFVLIKNDTKTVVAIEQMVEQQVEASGMDSRRLERLDGWRIIEAAIEAQE